MPDNYGQDGPTALEALLKQSFDLLVTDGKMPGMDGLSLAWVSRCIAPNMLLVMMTGQNRAELQSKILSLDLVRVIAKPFTMLELRKALQQAGVGSYVEQRANQRMKV